MVLYGSKIPFLIEQGNPFTVMIDQGVGRVMNPYRSWTIPAEIINFGVFRGSGFFRSGTLLTQEHTKTVSRKHMSTISPRFTYVV